MENEDCGGGGISNSKNDSDIIKTKNSSKEKEEKKEVEVEVEVEEEEEEEEFSDEFKCCVCLDLLYKPVVLACGHNACFFCIFKAMNTWHESRCPICRHPYHHLPNVCQLLHFLLVKLYPITYKRREKQLKEEEEDRYTSPSSAHLHSQLIESHPGEEVDVPSILAHAPSLPQRQESSSFGNSPEAAVLSSEDLVPSTSLRSSGGITNTTIDQKELKKQVSVVDLVCGECNKLLVRPLVLNCGHVYCETCIRMPTEGALRCQTCQSLHPNGLPSACFVLKHVLEEHFAELYAGRQKDLLKQNESSGKDKQAARRPLLIPNNAYSSWLFGKGPKIHVAAGCDSCGMCPIIGERYRCKDCVEAIGFDLCEECYKNPPKILGRFNQQHKPEHNFEIVQPPTLQGLMRLFHGGQSDEDGSYGAEDQEDGSVAPGFVNVTHNAENGSNDAEVVSPTLELSVDVAADEEDNSAHNPSDLT